MTYTETKAGQPVTIPLHPHAAALLKPVLDAAGDDPEAYLFTKRGSAEPWDCDSYKGRCARLRAKVAETYPEFAGVWLRDFRKVFKTRLLEAGINSVAVKVLQGHALTVDERYCVPSQDYLAKAILTLDWRSCREAGREAAEG